jgi:TetR/AcrR family transcriptional repressor of mexJK operon
MDAIAQAAGVSKRTIYSHFADKEALFQAVIAAEAGGFRPAPVLPPPADLGELRRRLIEYGAALMQLLTRPGILDLGRLLMSEARRHPELVARFYAWGPEASHRHLSAMLAEATALNLLTAESPDVAADQLVCMWQGMRHTRQQLGLCPAPSAEEIMLIVTRSVDVILRAYACPTKGTRGGRKKLD